MDTPQPNAPNHDDTSTTDWTWPIVGSVIVFLVFISWIGWATFFTIVLWCVIVAAIAAAAICAVVAINAEKDDETLGAWMFAGGGIVVALVAWFLIPSSSPSKNGIEKGSLKLAVACLGKLDPA